MRVHVRMAPRDPHEPHRVSTTLELFVDLAFVVAVAQAASALHHALVEDHVGDALTGYPLVFFAVWWAWMNFTWFASAYDVDDVLYRVAAFAQMTGVLVLAAGVPRALEERDFSVAVLGYVIMRLALVGQWLRVATSDRDHRRTALRYAGAIVVLQIGWGLNLLVPSGWSMATLLALGVGELAVPVWAERAGRTPWHPRHIAERYGLFTIIVLGESVLAATIAVQAALDADSRFADVATVVIGGLLIVFSMWWIYFQLPSERLTEAAHERDGFAATLFVFGYGHYVIFAAVAAAGAGLAVAVDQAVGTTDLPEVGAAAIVTVPTAAFVLAVWAMHFRSKGPGAMRDVVVPVAVALVLAATFTPWPVLLAGLVLVLLVSVGVALAPDEPERSPEEARAAA